MNIQSVEPDIAEKKFINPELLELLKKITPTTILGSSINMAFTVNYDKSLLVDELKELAEDNPSCMQKIIGKRAFDLLMHKNR